MFRACLPFRSHCTVFYTKLKNLHAHTCNNFRTEGVQDTYLSSEPVRNVVGMYFLPAFRQAWCFCQNHTKSVKFTSVDCQHFCVNSPHFSGLKKSRPSPYGISGLKKSHYGIYGWREVHKTFYGQVYGKANVLRRVCRILVDLWSKKVKQTLNLTRLWNL